MASSTKPRCRACGEPLAEPYWVREKWSGGETFAVCRPLRDDGMRNCFRRRVGSIWSHEVIGIVRDGRPGD
jgi:hypothetical protein